MSSRRFEKQREELALRLDEIIRECLSIDQIPLVNDAVEDVYGEFALGKYPQEREMRFYLGDVAAFTPRLINAIRETLADHFHEWSVVPQFEDRTFTISQNAVEFPAGKWTAEVTRDTPLFGEWVADAKLFDEKRFGPLRTQLRYLKPLLPKCIEMCRSQTIAAVAAFDYYIPYFWTGNPVIWVVLEPHHERPTVTSAERLRISAVTADGFVFPQYVTKDFVRYTEEQPVALLATFEITAPDAERYSVFDHDGTNFGEFLLPPILSRLDTEKDVR
jgi:hypothetical protein